MFCTKCGKEIKEGMKQCPFCGEIAKKGSIAKAAVSPDTKKSKKSKKTKIILVIIALLLIGGLQDAITENKGGKSFENRFEVSDNDLLNLLGMETEDAEKLFKKSNISYIPASDNSTMLLFDNLELSLISEGNYIVHVSNGDTSLKLCNIMPGDKESTAVEQMNRIGATLEEKEFYDSGYYGLQYSVKLNSATVFFNWIVDSNTSRISRGGASIE